MRVGVALPNEKAQFCDCDCVPCMWIAMAMRDRVLDVTTASVDMSNRVIDGEM